MVDLRRLRAALHRAVILIGVPRVLTAALILDLADAHGIRAWDATAFTAQQLFAGLTILDSIKTPVTKLEAVPKHNGVDQHSFHGYSNFPLSIELPDWFERAACRT